MNDRIPPFDIEAEEAVLGCCLLSLQALGDVIPILSPDDFYKPLHKEAFAAIESVWRRGDPVDAVTVSGEMSDAGSTAEAGWLMTLQGATPAISRARVYADRVVRCSRLRSVLASAAEMTDAAYQAHADPDEIHTMVTALANDARLLPRGVELPDDLMLMSEFLERYRSRNPEETADWLVPGMLRKKWRALFISTEGSGKSVALRQIATLVANGLHPFVGQGMPIPPRRVLVVDAENPEDVIDEQATLIDQLASTGLSESKNLWIWHVEGGLNLRSRKDQAKLEAVIQKVRPELVTMGPVYKLYSNGNTDWEQSAVEFVTFLDGLRSRFGFALLMEHHAPKGANGSRELVPFGSVVWQRWPEFGFRLFPSERDSRGHPAKLVLGRFRGDRVVSTWPKELVRGTRLNGVPWHAIWEDGTWNRREEPPEDEGEPF